MAEKPLRNAALQSRLGEQRLPAFGLLSRRHDEAFVSPNSKRVRPSPGTVQNGKNLDRSSLKAVGNNVGKGDQLACACDSACAPHLGMPGKCFNSGEDPFDCCYRGRKTVIGNIGVQGLDVA
jgi:hypothetical protein